MPILIKDVQKNIEEAIRETIQEALGEKPEDIVLTFPPEIKLGDFTLECFALSKQFKKAPAEIAKIIADKLNTAKSDLIEKTEATGPYVNIKIFNSLLFQSICGEAIAKGKFFGDFDGKKPQKVMVEYLSPNTNKPLHLGHLRNGSLGMAISNLFDAFGDKVVKANLVNDRGIHIAKSMLAWQKWANGETPESAGMKGDHFVGKWYVRYAQEFEKNPELEKEARAMLEKWEAGDPEVVRIWKIMNEWVYQGFSKTYEDFGLKFDKFYFESETYKLGKDIVEEGLAKKVFRRAEDGSVVFDLPQDEFGLDKEKQPKKETILRADGTSVYITQDLGTALLKVANFKLDRSIHVVGSEQNYHFKVLFKILKSLGYSWADGFYHLSYGMVYLPEGKMKSREGKVVDADDFISEIIKLAGDSIRERDAENKIPAEEVKTRSKKIAIGAIKFYMLRVNPAQDIHFDPKESLSLEGFTGPYCQYAFARISSIIRNAKNMPTLEEVDFSILNSDEERLIAQKIIQFPDEISKSLEELNPSRIATHTFELAKAFNQFYHAYPVLKAEDEKTKHARLVLIQSVAIALKKGLTLLGIETLEKM